MHPLLGLCIEVTYLYFIGVSVRAVICTFKAESSEVQNWPIAFQHHPRLVICNLVPFIPVVFTRIYQVGWEFVSSSTSMWKPMLSSHLDGSVQILPVEAFIRLSFMQLRSCKHRHWITCLGSHDWHSLSYLVKNRHPLGHLLSVLRNLHNWQAGCCIR